MSSWIDGALYPNTEVPEELRTLGVPRRFPGPSVRGMGFRSLPDREPIEEIRRPNWREGGDATRLLTSPTYHLVREWRGLPSLPYLGQQLAYIRDDPNLAFV